VADLEEGRGGELTPMPPLLGDGLTLSLTVMLPNVGHSTVKHGTQNIPVAF